MRWSDKQRAMLREIGIPAFWPIEAEVLEHAEAAAPPELVQPARVAVAEPIPARPRPEAPPQAPQAPQAQKPSPPPASSSRSPVAPPASAAPITLGPRPEGIDAMAWPELRAAVASCQACPLSASRTQAVFGVGHAQAEWFIVGEAPGEQEDKEGEPFVGRSGQLLDRMLQALSLTRAEGDAAHQVYIANAVKCRPPANRNPHPQEMAQCEPYLLRQIALVQPKVILVMGRAAVQSILKSSEPIGKLRGRVHQVAGIPLIVTYHPAYLLRNPVDKALAWADLCLAREQVALR
jgi:uracil-DNA glycosylase family 4